MSCYFRYLHEVFAEAGIAVTESNKRQVDQAIHAFVGVPYKRCMPARAPRAGGPARRGSPRAGGPDCWSKVKLAIHDTSQRTRSLAALQRVS